MGIVTQAIVEVHYDASEWIREHWGDLSRFSLGKVYSFTTALHEVGEMSWPVDASIKQWERNRQFIDQGLYHVIGSEGLALVIEQEEMNNKQWLEDCAVRGEEVDPVDRSLGTYPHIRALLAYVRALEAEDYRVRVLFYDT